MWAGKAKGEMDVRRIGSIISGTRVLHENFEYSLSSFGYHTVITSCITEDCVPRRFCLCGLLVVD